MDLRDALNQYYYDTTVCDLRQLSRTGGGELSYNSIMYLDVISFQEADGGCTVGRLAKTLRISAPAASRSTSSSKWGWLRSRAARRTGGSSTCV